MEIENKSKTGNRIFYTILILLILGAVSTTFYKIVIQKNYQIITETSCDPQTENCFVRTEEETTYYKIVSKKASDIALCEATTEKIGCDTELSCTQGEIDCSYTFCEESNVPEGETCSTSTQ